MKICPAEKFLSPFLRKVLCLPVVRVMKRKEKFMKELLDLFLLFAKIGATTFGGGYAMLPIIEREIVDKRNWATIEELMDYYAIGQCTPGIIAINTATFIGEKRRGIVGGIVATLGFVAPALIVITVIAAVLQNFAEYAAVQNAFAGIRVCVCILILNAVGRLWKKSVVDKKTLAIFLVVFALSVFTNTSPVILVVASAAAGILLQRFSLKKRKDGEERSGGGK